LSLHQDPEDEESPQDMMLPERSWSSLATEEEGDSLLTRVSDRGKQVKRWPEEERGPDNPLFGPEKE